MVSRKPPTPPPLEIKRFTPEELERGITKLQRRLVEVEAFDPRTTQDDESQAEVLGSDLQNTILNVFGENSPEYRENAGLSLWDGFYGVETLQAYKNGRAKALAILAGLIKRLEEKREDLGGTRADRVRTAFRGLDLHPRIAAVATDLYLNGHHNEAVFNASKALVNLVKERSGRYDLDGAPLMLTVFSKNAPVLAFNDLVDQTDRDEQEGMMHLYAGAVLAIRNPGGHDFPEESPDRALELIAFLSLLAKRADEAKKGTK
jgi:uncharacterized protein (TIGR02391 family)